MYRLLLSMALVLATSFAFGADTPTACTRVREPLKITISENLPPPITYTKEVKAMTDEQFFNWATDYNAKQKELSEVRSRNGEPQYFRGSVTVEDTHVTVPVNRGYGRYNRGYNNYGFDTNRTATQTTTIEQRPAEFRNPQYTGPGPLTIVNPYCRFKD